VVTFLWDITQPNSSSMGVIFSIRFDGKSEFERNTRNINQLFINAFILVRRGLSPFLQILQIFGGCEILR